MVDHHDKRSVYIRLLEFNSLIVCITIVVYRVPTVVYDC